MVGVDGNGTAATRGGWRAASEREKRVEKRAIPAHLTPEKEIHRESTLRESEPSAVHKGPRVLFTLT